MDKRKETKVQGALSRLLADKTVLVIAHRMAAYSDTCRNCRETVQPGVSGA